MKYLFLFLAAAGMVFAQSNVVDLGNSTTTNLTASGSFTGAARNLFANGTAYSGIQVYLYVNKASAVGGLRIQFSSDDVTYITTDSCSAVVGSFVTLSAPLRAKFYKVKYTNGTDSLTAISLQTIVTAISIGGSTVTLSGTPTVSLAGSVLYSKNATSSGTTYDTANFAFTTKKIRFVNDATSSDTMYISPYSTFPSNATILRIGGEFGSIDFVTSKLYIKFGNVAFSSGKAYRIEGY